MYLLAQFREPALDPLVLKIGMLPSDLLDTLLGDFVTEALGNVLALTCGGDIAGIRLSSKTRMRMSGLGERPLALLVTLVAAGVKSREEVAGYFGELFREKLTDTNNIVWSDHRRIHHRSVRDRISRRDRKSATKTGWWTQKSSNLEDVHRDCRERQGMGRSNSSLVDSHRNVHR